MKRPSTRSSVLNNPLHLTEDAHTVQITDTLDPIQKTFDTLPVYLPFWRYVMYQRYIGQYKPKHLITTWLNRGERHSPKPTTPVLEPSEIPPDHKQSTVTLSYKLPNGKNQKLIVIHMYYTTSRVLIQGKAFQSGSKKNFKLSLR